MTSNSANLYINGHFAATTTYTTKTISTSAHFMVCSNTSLMPYPGVVKSLRIDPDPGKSTTDADCCDPACESCDGPTSSDCIGCSTGLFKDGGSCVT